MTHISVALIGCGRIANHHCKAIKDTAGVELAAVCDMDFDKAATFEAEFGVPTYTNYRRMMREREDIDIVAIITPSGMHYEHSTDVVSDYGKHVIVEKPTFLRPQHLTDMYALAEKKSVQVFPVFQNRYNKAVRRTKQAIDEDELGQIQIINVRVRWCRPQRYYDLAPWRGTFSHDGGALSNQGIHHVDLLRYLGGEVSSVQATMKTFGADIPAEDTIVATLNFESGAVGSLEVTTAARPDDFEASLSIVGTQGLAQIGGIAVNELQIFTPDPSACAGNSVDFRGIKGAGAVYGYGHQDMYQDIVSHLNGEAGYPITYEDCLSTLNLLHAFYRSDEDGQTVSPSDGIESVRLGCIDDEISNLYRTPADE